MCGDGRGESFEDLIFELNGKSRESGLQGIAMSLAGIVWCSWKNCLLKLAHLWPPVVGKLTETGRLLEDSEPEEKDGTKDEDNG